MPIPTEEALIQAACHFGHPKQKWNPKIAPSLYGVRKGIHIFDVTQTRAHLEKVCAELAELQKAGKVILFVSTKQQAIPLIEEIGRATGQLTVTKKWLPGLLTNWGTMRKRLQYYIDLQHSFQTGEVEKYTKKEQTQLRKKLTKLDAALAGVAHMKGLPDALFVVDAVHNHVAVLEAKKMHIPLYGICDSNANPDEFTTFIPANDDAIRSITLILNTVRDALVAAKEEQVEETEESKEAKETTEALRHPDSHLRDESEPHRAALEQDGSVLSNPITQ